MYQNDLKEKDEFILFSKIVLGSCDTYSIALYIYRFLESNHLKTRCLYFYITREIHSDVDKLKSWNYRH